MRTSAPCAANRAFRRALVRWLIAAIASPPPQTFYGALVETRPRDGPGRPPAGKAPTTPADDPHFSAGSLKSPPTASDTC